ncbi:MAG TPA: hypothetical protein QF821_00790 [Candidatus Thalassarchaeaceae archaeon]|nr:hypothetical protein [Candidatus Thalassarchaeaceae archaeon]
MADPLISTLRISLLILCMATAARSDFATLTVRDSHWVRWAIPASLILLVEMTSDDTGFANICMTFSLIAIFSICFTSPPDPRELREWGTRELLLSIVYVLGLTGLVGGAITYSGTNFVDLVLGDESPNTTLWWSMFGAFLTSIVFFCSWRLGLIQGGADVKALILVTMFFPSWNFVPDQIFPLVEDPIFRMPPSMVMFIWAAAAFLIAPPVIFVHNATKGNIGAASDLKMAWHATKRNISELGEISELDHNSSWILTDVIEKDGEKTVVNRILPSRKSIIGENRVTELAILEEMGIESVWITRKHPFIVYLFFAILPMLLLGDPLAYLIR